MGEPDIGRLEEGLATLVTATNTAGSFLARVVNETVPGVFIHGKEGEGW